MSVLPTLGGGSFPYQFSPTILSHLRSNDDTSTQLIKGFVTDDCSISVTFCGPNLEVISKYGERLAAWTFSGSTMASSSKEKNSHSTSSAASSSQLEITCCIDLSNTEVTRHTSHRGAAERSSLAGRLLAIGLSDGQVCVFDISASRIIRSVIFGSRITALTSMASPTSIPRYLCEDLLMFHGLVAAGTQEGNVYLVDFALDELGILSDEVSSCHPYFADLKGPGSTEQLAQTRTKALQRGQLVCISLQNTGGQNSNRKRQANVFSYTDNVAGETTYFPEAGVVVSALEYVSPIGALLVGYNFGSWQLWNVSAVNSRSTPISLEFSSKYTAEALPVVGFTFQEPENDPRNFVYVWVLRGENDLDSEEEKCGLNSRASISLQALAFQSKDESDAGVLYSGLVSCNCRFSCQLDNLKEENFNSIKGSLCLGANALPLPSLSGHLGRKDVSEVEDGQVNLGLCSFLWEVLYKTNKDRLTEDTHRYFLGIFDLNAWYQAQMPDNVEIDPTSQCSFFSVCALDEQFEDEQRNKMNYLIHSRIDLSSISRYKSLSNAEQHFYPSSLAFNIVNLLDFGIVHANHLGLQRKVLLELRSLGRDRLVDPTNLFELCVVAGLIENATDIEKCQENLSQQRNILLTIALEHHLVDFMKGCLIHWFDGKYSDAGCTRQFLLEWAWNRVAHIKEAIDKDCMLLFDQSCYEIPESTRQLLVSQCRQLQHLKIIYAEALTLDPTPDVQLKWSIIELIRLYTDSILWFINVGLLPEKPFQHEDGGHFPVNDLVAAYSSKRRLLKSKIDSWLSKNHFDQDEFKGCSELLIDSLCSQLGLQLKVNFEREGGNGLFPPPNFHALLVCFLIPSDKASDLIVKHRIVQYLFLDMASCLSKKEVQQNDADEAVFVENLIRFPSAFSVPPSYIKLTQAYWLLDNEDFEEAIAMLLDPLVDANDISETEHRTVILALLTQNQPKLALKYCNVRKPPKTKDEDLQLHTAIYLANGMVQDAFQLMRSKTGANQRLFAYFLSKTENMGKMGTVLQMTLSMQEEKFLVDFLQQSQFESSKEILLEYYLQRARYSEATQLNQHLSQQQHRFQSGNKTRQAIIDRYSKLIPSMNIGDQFAKQSWIKPLRHMEPSMRVQVMPFDAQITPNFKASTLAKRNELLMQSFMPSVNEPLTPFRSKNQRQANLFRGKKFLEIPVPNDDDDDKEEDENKTEESNPLLSILSTPIIRRKTASLVQDKVAIADSTENGNRCHTPQSILKIKRLIQKDEESNSPQLPSQRIEKEEIPKRNDSRMSRESTPGKSLRFNVPKKLPPPTIDFEEEDQQPQKQQSKEASPLQATNEDQSESSSDLEIIDDDDVKSTTNVVDKVEVDNIVEANSSESGDEDEDTNQEIEDIDIESIESESKEGDDSAMLHLTDDEGDVEEETSITHKSDDDGEDEEDSCNESVTEEADDTNSTAEVKNDFPDQTVAMTPTTMQKFVSGLVTPKHPLIDQSEGNQTSESLEMTFNFRTPVDKTPHMSESEQKRFVASLVAQATPAQYSFANPDIVSPMTTNKNLVQVSEQSEEEEEDNEAEKKAEMIEETIECEEQKDESNANGAVTSEKEKEDLEEEADKPIEYESQEDQAEKDVTEGTKAKDLEKGEELNITDKGEENLEYDQTETEATKETPENEDKDLEMKEVDIGENETLEDQTGKEDKEETAEDEARDSEIAEDQTEKVKSASSPDVNHEVSANSDEEAEAKSQREEGDDAMHSSQPKNVKEEESESSGEAEDEPLQSAGPLDQTVPLTPSTMKRFLADLVREDAETVEETESPKPDMLNEQKEDQKTDQVDQENAEETIVNSRRRRHSSKTSSSTQNTPLRRSRRVSSKSSKQEEKLEIVSEDNKALLPSKRQRHSSRDSTDASAPLRRSRRISQSSHEGDHHLDVPTTEAVSAKPRRSRRVSQTSTDSDNPEETPLISKSSKRLAQKRTSTPRSTSKAKVEKKPLPMEPLTEEGSEEMEESNLDSVQPAGRKRQLSDASKLSAIIEEPTSVASPKKRGRKSISATAVMQRTTRRSMQAGGQSKTETESLKKSTPNTGKSRKAAVKSSPVEAIIEEAIEPDITMSPEKPETSKSVRPKRKTVSASSVPQKTPLTRSRSQATSVKVIDHVFSPMAKYGESVEDLATGTSEDEPKRSKRFSVRAKRTSYKF